MAELVSIDPAYRLHIAGAFQDLRYRIYFDHCVRTLGLQDNIICAGWVGDVDEWLEDKDCILSTSVFESFGMSIVEGMAKGMKPVVHNWPGAAGLHPDEILFGKVREAVAMITSSRFGSAQYRSFVADHYGMDQLVNAVEQLIIRAVEESNRRAGAIAA